MGIVLTTSIMMWQNRSLFSVFYHCYGYSFNNINYGVAKQIIVLSSTIVMGIVLTTSIMVWQNRSLVCSQISTIVMGIVLTTSIMVWQYRSLFSDFYHCYGYSFNNINYGVAIQIIVLRFLPLLWV